VADDNLITGVRFGRRRGARSAPAPDPAASRRDEAIELLVEGTDVLARALAILAAGAPDDGQARALRSRCDGLRLIVQDHARALTARRVGPERTSAPDAREARSKRASDEPGA